MKKNLLCILLLFTTTEIFCQFNEADYRKQADEIRSEIWNSKLPFFDQRNVPAEYEKYSKVILARREELSCIATSKLRFKVYYGYTRQSDLAYTHLFREVVKINDEVSLQDYSEMSFNKFSRYINSKTTSFLGFRIIKPDGNIKEIDPDEIILTENKDNNKKAKVAVSGLQIGDIVDYFIETISTYKDQSGLYDEFNFAEEEPMLHYSVHIEINNNLYLEYHSMNGAPEFKVTHDSDNTILDVEKNNINQYPITLWLSRYRQVPLVRISILPESSRNNRHANNVIRTSGSSTNTPPDNILRYWQSVLESYRLVAKKALNSHRGKIKKMAASYLDHNVDGTIENNSLGYYYALRHYFFLQPDKAFIYINDLSSNYSSFESTLFLSTLQMLLDENNFDAQIIIIPSRFGPTAGEAMYGNDFALALLTNDKHIYTARCVFDCPDQLPYYLQGQPPTSLYKSIDFDYRPGDMGYNFKSSTAENNMRTEELLVDFNPAEPGKIKVDRSTILTGESKTSMQKILITDEDYYEEERKVMGISESFIEELSSTKKGKKIGPEYESAFEEIRKAWKDYMKYEIATHFDIDTSSVELLNCNIEQAGIFNNKPEFIYKTQFAVNTWVKTAGNNYIIEVGKMVMPDLSLTPEQRERQVDIYMPYATTSQYNVTIPVPAGYNVEGIDKLNTTVNNTTGSFVSTASLDSGKIILHVAQTFDHAFEKADKWQELLDILDAATSFENAKILLRKE